MAHRRSRNDSVMSVTPHQKCNMTASDFSKDHKSSTESCTRILTFSCHLTFHRRATIGSFLIPTHFADKKMAREGSSRSKKQRKEESFSESADDSRSRQRSGKRRSKKRKEESSEEEGSSSESSEEDSSDSGESSAEESPPRHKTRHRRPKEEEESSADERSPPPRRKAPPYRRKKDDESEELESEQSSGDNEAHRADRASSHRRPEPSSEEVSPERRGGQKAIAPSSSDRDGPRPRQRRNPRPPEPDEDHEKSDPSRSIERGGGESARRNSGRLGNMDSPLSPPAGYIEGPDDDLEKALKASTLQANKTPKRSEWVENDKEIGEAMEASKRAAKKAPVRKDWVEDETGLQQAIEVTKRTAKKTPVHKEWMEDEKSLREAVEATKRAAKKAPIHKEWVEDEKSLREAMEATKRAAKSAPQHPNGDDEEEMRRVLELSQQESHQPSANSDDDEELKKILEASMQEASEHEARLKEARAQKAREKEVLKDSKRTLEEDKKRQKAAQQLADEEYQKQKRDAILENKAEWKSKQARRKQVTAWERQRAKEIADEQREARRAEREQQARAASQDAAATRNSGQRAGGRYHGGPGRLHAIREDDDEGDAEFQEQLRAAQAASLGDTGAQSIPTIDEEGWAIEDMPPSYQDINRKKNRTILNPEKYTTSTRDIAKGGSKVPLTDQLKQEMIQYECRMRVAAGEALESPNDPKAPAYKKTGSKAEARALRGLISPTAPARKTKATAIVDNQVRQNHNRDFGQRWMNEQDRRDVQQNQARTRRENAMNRPFSRIPASRGGGPRGPAATVDPRNRI